MFFIVTLDRDADFGPASLIEQFANKNKQYYKFIKIDCLLECDGSIFAFDHWVIQRELDYIRVTVHLKVLKDAYTE